MIWLIGKKNVLLDTLCSYLDKKGISFITTDEVDYSKSDSIDSFIKLQESKSYLPQYHTNKDTAKIKWIINLLSFDEQDFCNEENITLISKTIPQNLARISRQNGIKYIHLFNDYFDSPLNFLTTGNLDFKKYKPIYNDISVEGNEIIINNMTQFFIFYINTLIKLNDDSNDKFIKTLSELDSLQIPDRKCTPVLAKEIAEVIVTVIEKINKNTESFNAKQIIPYGAYNVCSPEVTWEVLFNRLIKDGIKSKKITKAPDLTKDISPELSEKAGKISFLDFSQLLHNLKIKLSSPEKVISQVLKK